MMRCCYMNIRKCKKPGTFECRGGISNVTYSAIAQRCRWIFCLHNHRSIEQLNALINAGFFACVTIAQHYRPMLDLVRLLINHATSSICRLYSRVYYGLKGSGSGLALHARVGRKTISRSKDSCDREEYVDGATRSIDRLSSRTEHGSA